MTTMMTTMALPAIVAKPDTDAKRLAYLAKFCRNAVATGKTNNGDGVASLLAGKSPANTLTYVESAMGLHPGSLADRYSHLNPGMRRMNAGNLLRGHLRRAA